MRTELVFFWMNTFHFHTFQACTLYNLLADKSCFRSKKNCPKLLNNSFWAIISVFCWKHYAIVCINSNLASYPNGRTSRHNIIFSAKLKKQIHNFQFIIWNYWIFFRKNWNLKKVDRSISNIIRNVSIVKIKKSVTLKLYIYFP